MSSSAEVAIVEDHTLLAESLAMALRLRDLSPVVVNVRGRAWGQILDEVRGHSPRVVLLDLDLGVADVDGATLISPLRRTGTEVVVLTGSQDPVRHGQCLADGASQVLAKSAVVDDVVHVVRHVLEGRHPEDVRRSAELVREWHAHVARQRQIAERFDRLTERERQVLGALVSGMRPTEIAEGYHVSKHTVRSQVKSILTKLGVASQLEAVAEAHRIGWSAD
jgi:two-component system, NarL family, nitrate/nitrite response regulator NarL